MDLKYVVHTISQQSRMQVGEFNGQTLSAAVPGVEMELSDPTGMNGSMVLFFTSSEDQAYVLKSFKAGDSITLSLSPVQAKPTSTKA